MNTFAGFTSRHHRAQGFTLIELMIVTAVIAILATMAYPSYKDFILKSRRTEAKVALMENMHLFERHFSLVNTYGKSINDPDTPWDGYNKYSGDNASSGFYTIEANTKCGKSSGDGQCVELQAKPKHEDANCGTLVLRSNGEKGNILSTSIIIPPTAKCW